MSWNVSWFEFICSNHRSLSFHLSWTTTIYTFHCRSHIFSFTLVTICECRPLGFSSCSIPALFHIFSPKNDQPTLLLFSLPCSHHHSLTIFLVFHPIPSFFFSLFLLLFHSKALRMKPSLSSHLASPHNWLHLSPPPLSQYLCSIVLPLLHS